MEISACLWSGFGGMRTKFDSFLPPKEMKNVDDGGIAEIPIWG